MVEPHQHETLRYAARAIAICGVLAWMALIAFGVLMLVPMFAGATPPQQARPDRSDEVIYPAEDGAVLDVTVDQLSQRRLRADGALRIEAVPSSLPRDDRTTPPSQISRSGGDSRPVAQAGVRDRATGTGQLATGRSAQAAAPLSSTRQSTPAPVVRLTGKDRCDAATDGRTPAICADAIETRAAEFQRPNPLTLSPEQRLLVDQRVRAAQGGPGGAARGLAGEIDENAIESQSIAAMALNRGELRDGTALPDGATLEGFDQPTLDILQRIVEAQGGQFVVPPPQ